MNINITPTNSNQVLNIDNDQENKSNYMENHIKSSENIDNNLLSKSYLSEKSFQMPSFTEKDFAKASSQAMITYLNDKIRYLEAENKILTEEITKNHSLSEKEKINYYLRLRKELIEENEKLISEKRMIEISLKGQVDKLNLEVNDLKEKLRVYVTSLKGQSKKMELFSKEKEEKLGNSQIQPNLSESIGGDLFSNTKYFKNCDVVLKAKAEDDKTAIQKLLKEQKDRQIGPKNSIYNLNKKDHNNPFIPVIDDLEERVKLLEKTIHEKEAEILELNEVINTNEQIANRNQEGLRVEINKWKEKYLLILATRKTISQEFSELNIKTTENIKKSMAKQVYDMESKILHLEKLNLKLNDDMKNITTADHDHDKQKLNQIINLKRDLKALLENYDDLYRNYEESLKLLTKQIDSIKQLYLTRENEFINITNYYIETINDFSKPVTDLVANPSNVRQLEEALLIQNKQTEEMRKTAQKYIKENSLIKSENFESKAIMRQKINDAMKFYDDSIKNISDNHSSIEQKLSKISLFMETFDQKFVYFNSLIEDKKILTDRVNELEIKIRMMTNDDQSKEILRLRESNFKLSKELESKLQLLKDMEEIQESIFTNYTDNHLRLKSTANKSVISNDRNVSFMMTGSTKNNNSNQKGESPKKSKMMKDMSFETILKMKAEVALLNSQLTYLNKSKEEIELYYQEEMKKLISLVDERNETIDELKATISKSENEHFAKKETIFNLWMIEFKEFKENLITITDIKGIVEKFKIEGGELKIQRDKLINEEIYLLRQEIKTKDKSISDLKSNYKKENSNLNEVLEQYRKGIEGRISSLELMLTQRGNEITALRNEKERVLGIEKRKKELTESELILWAEQKESIKVFLQEHMNSKDKEIQILKLAVETMQTELDFSKKSYDEAMDNLIKSNETQIQLIKERENFTTKQLLELEQKMKNFREEKEKLINLLKSEIEELRANNVLISKLRNDKLMQEDKPISTSPNNKDERNRDDDGRENDDKFK